MSPLLEVGVCERLARLTREGRTEELLAALGGSSPNVVDDRDESLLMIAAYHGHAGTARALLDRGADPSLRNARGLSPLDGAAFKGFHEVIEVLLEGGADIDDRGPDGQTALMWAASLGRKRAIAALLDRGANHRLIDRAGLTADDHARSMAQPAIPYEGAR